MSLSDLASLGSFVSGFAVLVSLIYLALQVRQAEKNQRALIHQGRTAQVSDRVLRMAEPDLVRVYLKNALEREPLVEEIEFQVFSLLSGSIYREVQDAYFQHDNGLLDDAGLNNHLGIFRGALATAGGKALWRVARDIYDPAFVARGDAIDRSVAVRSGNPSFERYKAELAKIAAGT
jgi:hypothetical protein